MNNKQYKEWLKKVTESKRRHNLMEHKFSTWFEYIRKYRTVGNDLETATRKANVAMGFTARVDAMMRNEEVF